MTGKCVFCKYLDLNVKENLNGWKSIWLKTCLGSEGLQEFLSLSSCTGEMVTNQERFHCKTCPCFCAFSSLSILFCLKVPAVYRWLIGVVWSHTTPLPPKSAGSGGCLRFSVWHFFHSAYKSQTDANNNSNSQELVEFTWRAYLLLCGSALPPDLGKVFWDSGLHLCRALQKDPEDAHTRRQCLLLLNILFLFCFIHWLWSVLFE